MANESVKFTNLPGTYAFKNDGNLTPEVGTSAPRTLIIGTAGKGTSEPFLAPSTQAVKSEFGTDGTIYRGMWEAKQAGSPEIMVLRIGATPAVLQGVGSDDATGYKIETVLKDDTAGAAYKMYYDDSEDRLVVQRVSDSVVVFDNSDSAPIDLFEVVVSGTRKDDAGGPYDDVGDSSNLVVLELVTSLSSPPAAVEFTAGTDGVDLSRMEMYEAYYNAYTGLLSDQFDVIVPMDVYLDDFNVVDQGSFIGAVVPVLPSVNTYPTAGAYKLGLDVDSLGKVFVEEYQGVNYFWWDLDGDGTAEIFPAATLGLPNADASTKIDGDTLLAADFHEVNFAYQLSRFLYDYSTNIVDATGTIGVLPPNSSSITDKALWLGKAPTLTIDNQTGVGTVESGDNGYGLLGNKFMAGRDDHRQGVAGGGFIANTTQWLDDGDEIVDDNDIPLDLGKYISVVSEYPLLRNNFNQTGYIASYAASYAGVYVNLDPASAPTNKLSQASGIVYKINLKDLDKLVGTGYVALRQKPGVLVIADAPSAALPTSDWNRLSTVRIVQKVIEDARTAAEPFLGESMSTAKRSALENAVEQKSLVDNKKAGYLKDYGEFAILQTPDQEVQGRAEAVFTLQPAFELRQLVITVNLSKSG